MDTEMIHCMFRRIFLHKVNKLIKLMNIIHHQHQHHQHQHQHHQHQHQHQHHQHLSLYQITPLKHQNN
ncbi:hypothetical protein Glove_9g186 [Diversispora epigaea]|uniref:Uncharacterized protein n=1 Tax=Diversispora epigaea TaxID=1348612 RepID=A0A397JZI3_9GLOM|nr:hypothetical protein Glove_9g186 [Diversispora epigaea]